MTRKKRPQYRPPPYTVPCAYCDWTIEIVDHLADPGLAARALVGHLTAEHPGGLAEIAAEKERAYDELVERVNRERLDREEQPE